MTDDEQTRDEIEEIDNEEEPVQETVIETGIEEEGKPVKAKPKAKTKPKPNINIAKEPVEPIKEEPEPVVEERRKHNDKLKEMVNCPDCNLPMTQRTLKYIHKKEVTVKEFKKSKKKLNLRLKL